MDPWLGHVKIEFLGVMANSYSSQKYSDKVMALMGIAISFGRNRYGSGESVNII